MSDDRLCFILRSKQSGSDRARQGDHCWEWIQGDFWRVSKATRAMRRGCPMPPHLLLWEHRGSRTFQDQDPGAQGGGGDAWELQPDRQAGTRVVLEAVWGFELGHLIVEFIYTFKSSFWLFFGAWVGEQSKNGSHYQEAIGKSSSRRWWCAQAAGETGWF